MWNFKIRSLIITAAFAAAFLGSAALKVSTAAADSKCDEENEAAESTGTTKKKKKNYRTVTGPDGRKVFVIEKAFVVCGKVPKPTVIYVLQASTINYEWETLKRDFLPKVLGAVRKAPF